METDAVNRRHADGAGDDVLDFLKLALEGVIGLDDLLAVFVEDLAFAGEPELFLAPFDEERLELTFKGTDLLADGGLRDPVDLRGFGKTLRFGEVAEDFQTFYLHKLIQF